MSVIRWTSRLLGDPRLKKIVDWEGVERIQAHRRILLEKRMIRQVFVELYDKCMELDGRFFAGQGKRVEIGAGVSIFKERYPEIVSSDILAADHLDMVIDAQAMNLEADSVRAFYGMNCFHHFPQPERFFNELNRVLIKGGGCILLEPYYGLVAKRFYQKVFDVEIFDMTQPTWEGASSVVLGANQALSYIVFTRDRDKFQKLFPDLEIVYHKPAGNYVRYVVSGGLNFRSLLPSACSPLLRAVEYALTPFNRILALHQFIVLRKRISG